MDSRFAGLVETLAPKLETLLAMEPLRFGQFPKVMAQSGVYLFSEGQNHLYVGRSNVLRKRYQRHFRTHRSAAFAFLIARQETDRRTASYKKGDESREGLMKHSAFAAAFAAAKHRMRDMDYRYVEERDQVRQALLEIYCAVVL
jgi:hypothetical protein